MSPINWALRPLKRYADFSGCSPRAEYWWFFLLQILLVGALLTLAWIRSGGASEANSTEAAAPALEGGVLLIGLIFLALLIPNLAVQVGRLHEQDKSGWSILLFFIPYIRGIIAFVFMCIRGTKGSNRYGPDPYAAENLHGRFA